MAGIDKINLIEELTEKQGDNDYIILTTFSFDPVFFDNFLLQKIRLNNPLAEIIVLIDAGQYEAAQSRFTNQTGRIYHLIPIYLHNGVFHPKIFSFFSVKNKTATCYVGSSNLTHAGFTRNAELVLKAEYSEENFDENINIVNDFFQSLILKGFVQDDSVVRILKQAFEWITVVNPQSSQFRFIHNINEPIFPQMKAEIKEDVFKEIFLFAPHFSPNESVIKAFNSAYDIKKISLGIQINNHNLNYEPYFTYFSDHNIKSNFFQVEDNEDESRLFHSKVIHLKGKTNYLLTGSPNITVSALLTNSDAGNIELAVLFNGKKTEQITHKLSLLQIEDPTEIKRAPEKFIESDSSNQLRIYSLIFDDITRIITVITEEIDEKAKVSVKVENGDPFVDYFDLHEGKISLKLAGDQIPIEIEISCLEKKANRRIYYDRGVFLRNIPRTNISIQEISNHLLRDFTLSTSEIYSLLVGLGRRNADHSNITQIDEQVEHSVSQNSNKDSSHFPKPSKIYSSGDIQHSIRMIERLSQHLDHIKRQQYISENFSREEIEREEHTNHSFILEKEKTEINKILFRFINTVNDVTLHAFELSKDNKSPDDLIHTESTFLIILFRSASRYIELEHLVEIYDFLDENLNKIKRDNFKAESSLILFENLLTWNYALKTYYKPENISSIVDYSIVIEDEAYFRVKEFVLKNYQNYNYSDQPFDTSSFQDYYGSLLTFSLDSSKITKGSLSLVKALKSEKDHELIELYGSILLKLKNGSKDNSAPNFSLRYARKEVLNNFNPNTFTSKARNYLDEFLRDEN